MIEMTVDSVVRRVLASAGLTHHFYLDFLVHALRGLRDMNIDVLHRIGTKEETIDDNDQVPMPTDSIGIIGVYVEIGDKIKPLYKLDKINPKTNAGSYPVVPYEDLLDKQSPYSPFMFKGRKFEKGLYWNDYYREIEEEQKIRFDNRYNGSDVLIVYVTNPHVVSNASLLPEYAESALFEFMIWQWSRFHPENRFDHRLNRREYYNERRKLRARKFRLNIDDYIRSIRSKNT